MGHNTEELLRPEMEEMVVPKYFWQRWKCPVHCFHKNPRHSDSSQLVRTCCHCGRHERSVLVAVESEHGTYAPDSVDRHATWIWGPREACSFNYGGYY